MERSIERLAMRNEEMPTGLSSSEQMLYQSLRLLYLQYHQGTIDRETASREKRKIIQTFESNQRLERQWEQTAKLWQRLEAPMESFRANPIPETAKRCMELLYGVPIRWKYKEKDGKSS